jgi:hypothetical protein
VLNALIDLDRSAGQEKPAAQSRLVWWLNWYPSGHCSIVPREQKRTARGNWTKGRPVALKRLYAGAGKLDFLTSQDIEVCAAIRQTYESTYGYYGNTVYEIDDRQALPALVGHPLVFWEDAPEVRVELIKGEPELLVTENRGKLRIERRRRVSKSSRSARNIRTSAPFWVGGCWFPWRPRTRCWRRSPPFPAA